MKKQQQTINCQSGLSLTEVILAVTIIATTLVIAIAGLSDMRATQNFRRSTDRFVSEINDILNDISSGNLPETNETDCEVDITKTPNEIVFTADTSLEAGDSSCPVLGQLIQFGAKAKAQRSYDDPATKYVVHTLVGGPSNLETVFSFDGFADTVTGNLTTLYQKTAPVINSQKTVSMTGGLGVAEAFYKKTTGGTTETFYLLGLAVVVDRAGINVGNLAAVQAGAPSTSIRAVRYEDDSLAKSPSQNRLANAETMANSLKRPQAATGITEIELVKLETPPIYICLDDGRNNRAVIIIGDSKRAGLKARLDSSQSKTVCIP